MEPLIDVSVIDDDRMLKQGMAVWLARSGKMRLRATASTVPEFLATDPEPGIVILDLHLGDHSDPTANVADLVALGHKVIIMSVVPEREWVMATTEAGALAYLTKDNDLEALLAVVRDTHAGRSTTTREHAFLLSRDNRPTRPRLSPREQEILRAVGEGTPHKTIARRLGIKPTTVQTHLQRIRSKYAVVGRPIDHAGAYSDRIREDGLGRSRLGPAPGTAKRTE